MRIYRANKDIKQVSIDEKPLIYKGQMFFVDSVADLPNYDEKFGDVDWQELGLSNNYGTIQLTSQKRN